MIIIILLIFTKNSNFTTSIIQISSFEAKEM